MRRVLECGGNQLVKLKQEPLHQNYFSELWERFWKVSFYGDFLENLREDMWIPGHQILGASTGAVPGINFREASSCKSNVMSMHLELGPGLSREPGHLYSRETQQEHVAQD